jgi:hypothetical protein
MNELHRERVVSANKHENKITSSWTSIAFNPSPLNVATKVKEKRKFEEGKLSISSKTHGLPEHTVPYRERLTIPAKTIIDLNPNS